MSGPAAAAMAPAASMAPAEGMAARARLRRARAAMFSAGAILAAGAIAAAGPDTKAAGPDFEAAGPDLEVAGPDNGNKKTTNDGWLAGQPESWILFFQNVVKRALGGPGGGLGTGQKYPKMLTKVTKKVRADRPNMSKNADKSHEKVPCGQARNVQQC